MNKLLIYIKLRKKIIKCLKKIKKGVKLVMKRESLSDINTLRICV